MDSINKQRTDLELIAHRFNVANDRMTGAVIDYMLGDILIRESWHPAVKKYIVTVDGAASPEEAEEAMAQVLMGNVPMTPQIPPSIPALPPSEPPPPSESGPPERRSS